MGSGPGPHGHDTHTTTPAPTGATARTTTTCPSTRTTCPPFRCAPPTGSTTTAPAPPGRPQRALVGYGQAGGDWLQVERSTNELAQ